MTSCLCRTAAASAAKVVPPSTLRGGVEADLAAFESNAENLRVLGNAAHPNYGRVASQRLEIINRLAARGKPLPVTPDPTIAARRRALEGNPDNIAALKDERHPRHRDVVAERAALAAQEAATLPDAS